ncbi:hypothetical protein E5676_scaffold434G001720 [Cucumis melo var. makuwa]|uniref:C2H2-type domain-containing protein n=1 Tax=Cucumis melo var. makuwa TaxID=1194695 RepID=A0A5A7U6I9_CUCMM|nr:hypothetical protein E6C27_scaffold171G004810 [Cucumis melo var. makuwa]TYK17317.1 hypothetical protein E5676_scaffold434G001720 [Cucumis melo var. makuwa]
MAFLLQPPLFALFFLTSFSPSWSLPWNSSSFGKSGSNPSLDDMLFTSSESSSRPSRQNTIFGAPCGLCGQVIFGSEALNHHYNYHFLQNELASFRGHSNPCSGVSHRPPFFHGQASASREPQMTLNDYLTMPPSLRSHSGAAIDMAHFLPLHPLLARPPPLPRTSTPNSMNFQQNQAVARQRRQGNQIRWNNGRVREVGGQPASEQQPPQDVIDLSSEENDCSSDGSEGLDLTLSL